MRINHLHLILGGFFLVLLSVGACSRQSGKTDYPHAEWDPARVILMHTPGQELFNGALHPSAALFEKYFDVDLAAEEHRGYIRMLERNGIRVYTVSGILNEIGIDSLRILANLALTYDVSDIPDENPEESEAYRQETLSQMSREDLIRNSGFRIIPIDHDDEMHYANNYLTIAPRHIMAVGGQSETLQHRFRDAGVRVEWIPLESLIDGYGAAHCMTQVLLREPGER